MNSRASSSPGRPRPPCFAIPHLRSTALLRVMHLDTPHRSGDSWFNDRCPPNRQVLHSLPQAYWFGRVPPYRMFYLRQQTQTFLQDILCGVHVSVVGYAAYRASPFPHGKVFCSGPLSAAYRTNLAGWIEAIYGYEPFPIPLSLVG